MVKRCHSFPFLLVLVVLQFPFENTLLAKDGYSIPLGLGTDGNFNVEFGLGYVERTRGKYWWLEGILAFSNTAESYPDYAEFSGSPYSWWEYRDKRKISPEWELLIRIGLPSKEWNVELGLGMAFQKYVELYRSTATGLYFGRVEMETYFSYSGGIAYRIYRGAHLYLNLHNRRGVVFGVKLSSI